MNVAYIPFPDADISVEFLTPQILSPSSLDDHIEDINKAKKEDGLVVAVDKTTAYHRG